MLVFMWISMNKMALEVNSFVWYKHGFFCETRFQLIHLPVWTSEVPTSVPVTPSGSVVSIPMLWVRVLFLSARPSVSSDNRKRIRRLMLTLAVIKVVQKRVNRAMGRVRMLNRAKVDRALPTSNGLPSRSGYRMNVCKVKGHTDYHVL